VNVWENQKNDVHPPLYYLILHTICSLFPGKFSIWFAGIINIIFALMTLYILRKLVNVLVNNNAFTAICSWAFILSSGILSSITFLRMYVMAMYFVTLMCYLFVNLIQSSKLNWKSFLPIFSTAVAGAMTHYYCIVYLLFVCFVFGIYLLIEKGIKITGIFTVMMAASGALSIAIFPAMINHILFGYRGTESRYNLEKFSISDISERLNGFYLYINRQLFGNMFVFVIAFVVIVCIYMKISKGKILFNLNCIQWCIMIIPTFLYFLIVSKMAVYIADRYIFPIYPVALVCILCLVYYGASNVFNKKIKYIFICIVCTIITFNSWRMTDWDYLFTKSSEFLSEIDNYRNLDCVYLYDEAWKIQNDYYEIKKYNSITYVKYDNINILSDLDCTSSPMLIIKVNGNEEDILNQVIDICQSFDKYEKIGTYAWSSTYFVSKK
jgi:hypothetical protein